MAYLPIEDHGIIGDLQSVALVGIDGTIDWCCLPHFDSPSVFAGILDDVKGGWFKLEAEQLISSKQMYLPDSAILLTRAYTENGLAQIEDFMPIADPERMSGRHQIIRRVRCVRGSVSYRAECRPAFNFAMDAHQLKLIPGGALFEAPGSMIFGLKSDVPLRATKAGAVLAEISLSEGDTVCFVFFAMRKDVAGGDPFSLLPDPENEYLRTTHFWHRWSSRCTYRGRWSEMIVRSAITLKLLTFAPTGAIVAAATTSLPEDLGGHRNWDYRFTWIRDASFTLYALMRIGYTEEAGRFMDWLSARFREVDDSFPYPLHLIYGIHGEHMLPERTLDHLDGYRGSRPVRIGNDAYSQLQLDIYGELLDAVYLYNKYGTPISHQSWSDVRRLVDWLCENWDQPDEGIWETRGGKKDFVFSRLMCWVALDRASRMCIKHSLPGSRERWQQERDLIYDQIMDRGWSEERQSFRQHFGTDRIDAANLLMPLVKFISPTDPRMSSTIDATLKAITTDSLVYRYDTKMYDDGLRGGEGTFSICTFWLVECLTRAGRLGEAQLLFQKMLGFANHLGLYSEQIGLHGEMLGNFPQAFTHLSLISAAYNLNRALEGKL